MRVIVLNDFNSTGRMVVLDIEINNLPAVNEKEWTKVYKMRSTQKGKHQEDQDWYWEFGDRKCGEELQDLIEEAYLVFRELKHWP